MSTKKRTLSKKRDDESGDEGLKIPKPLQPSVTGEEFLAAKQVQPFLTKNKKLKYTKKEIMNLAGYLSNRGPIVLQFERSDIYNEVSAILRDIDKLNEIPAFVEIADPIIVYINWGAAPVPVNYVATLETINILQGGTVNAVGNAGEPISFIDGVNSLLMLDTDETYQRVVEALKGVFPLAGQVHIIRMNPTTISMVN